MDKRIQKHKPDPIRILRSGFRDAANYFKQKKHCVPVNISLFLALAVVVESLTSLHTQFPLLHHLVDELAGPGQGEVWVVVDVLVQVDPGVVQQFKRSHGVAQPQLHCRVNILQQEARQCFQPRKV